MTRILLYYVLPLLFPAAVYFLWMKLRGNKREEEEEKKDPWFWLILAGLLLMAAGFALAALVGDKTTSGTYERPRLEDGKIIPGHIDPSTDPKSE